MKPIFVYLTLFIFLTAFSPPRLKQTTVAPGISVLLPKDFTVMTDDVIATKYPAPRKPLGAYTSPTGQVDFVVSERASTFKKEDLAMLQQFYRSALLNKYSEVNFSREEIKKINQQEYIVFEFTSTMRDEERRTNKLAPIRRYTIVQYTILNDKLLIFTFHVPADLKEAWQPTAQKIMQSIKIS